MSKDTAQIATSKGISKESLMYAVKELSEVKPQKNNSIVLTGKETPAELLKMAEVTQDEQIEQEPICIEIGNGENWSTLGTLGNFSLIIGKAKSRKTFFHSFFSAAWINNGVLNNIFRATPPPDQTTCLFFDTEQSRFHVQRVVKRVVRMTGRSKAPEFTGYNLRRYSHEQRIKVIEEAIYNTPRLGLIVIDGVRDLVSDINSPDEATKIASLLLKWSEEKNIHIVTILHQNKGNNDARGHLGTELQNKAETTVSVTKEGEISIVAPEYCRDKDFEPFAFGIDGDGLPIPVDYTKPNSDKPRTVTAGNIDVELLKRAVSISFSKEAKQKHSNLLTNLKLSLEGLGVMIGNNKVKEIITRSVNDSYILTEGTSGTKNFLYSSNIPY